MVCYCGAEMRKCTGPYGDFFGCSRWPACDGKATLDQEGNPGVPSDQATRDARKRAHVAFDPLWESGTMSRWDAYRWFRVVLGLSAEAAHIGRLNVDQCVALEQACAAREGVQGPGHDVRVLISRVRELDAAATKDWCTSGAKTGAAMVSAPMVGLVGKFYDADEGKHSERPTCGDANARLAVEYRLLTPLLADDCEALLAEVEKWARAEATQVDANMEQSALALDDVQRLTRERDEYALLYRQGKRCQCGDDEACQFVRERDDYCARVVVLEKLIADAIEECGRGSNPPEHLGDAIHDAFEHHSTAVEYAARKGHVPDWYGDDVEDAIGNEVKRFTQRIADLEKAVNGGLLLRAAHQLDYLVRDYPDDKETRDFLASKLRAAACTVEDVMPSCARALDGKGE